LVEKKVNKHSSKNKEVLGGYGSGHRDQGRGSQTHGIWAMEEELRKDKRTVEGDAILDVYLRIWIPEL
jgi:hypothetical protein